MMRAIFILLGLIIGLEDRSSLPEEDEPAKQVAPDKANLPKPPVRDAEAEDPKAAQKTDAGLDYTRYAAGKSPRSSDGVHTILDGVQGASNAIAFPGSAWTDDLKLSFQFRITKGGDGGAICLLNTAEYGERGPAPFVKLWTEPNLKGSLAVGIDVHNPRDNTPFGEWGNYQGFPEREISLHWDGREIVKRVAPKEFRGDWADCEIRVRQVVGGAEISVRIAGADVYDNYFIPAVTTYKARLAIGGGTRKADAPKPADPSEFAIRNLEWDTTEREAPATQRPPKRFQIFNHVLTDNATTSFTNEVTLPPPNWAYGRIILTLQIHDAGEDWDEWDRNGEVYVFDDDGKRWSIAPFISSYRTECFWRIDVTHFRPWLHGKRKFEIHCGTGFYKNRGFLMSMSLDFYPGMPKLEPYRIDPLWNGRARYKSDDNHFRDFFDRKTIAIDRNAAALKLWMTTTGHSQIGEFTPSSRSITFGGKRFTNRLWKTDNYLNPNRPQFGTWKYSRAGWAPGDYVRPWWIDLTPHMQPGRKMSLRYEPSRYKFGRSQPPQNEINKAVHVVRSYAIFYREPALLIAPPALRVMNVVKDSNADKAGMRRGDYIARYDGQAVLSLPALRKVMAAAEHADKDQVTVVIYRGSEPQEVKLPTGRMGVNLSAR